MWIKWLGHAAFLITSDSGLRIITDPYKVEAGVEYAAIDEAADIVTVSHHHFDHDNVAAVKGSPKVVDGAGIHDVKGIEFKGVATQHDTTGGSQRGNNVIYVFEVDGIRVCHLGDLGHPLDSGQIADIGPVDILITPVGGEYTIDAAVATRTCEAIAPKVVIPMHFKTAGCAFPIAPVEDFLEDRSAVRRLDDSQAEFKKVSLPAKTETVVLKHAR